MPGKKRRRMTKADIARRARAKKELQAEGIIPPDKPRLNRKKFAREAGKLFNENLTLMDAEYVRRAMVLLCPLDEGSIKATRRFSDQQVGIMKVIRLANDLKRFEKEKIAEGATKYPIDEMIKQVLVPIMKL